MNHIKTLGLLVALAVTALTAFVGTASAHTPATFTAGKVGAALTTTTPEGGNHVFSVTGSNTECKTIKFNGSTEALKAESQNVHPEYENCTAFGFAATVDVTNCKFIIKADGTVGLVKTKTEPTDPVCSIKITVNNVFASCEVTVGEQSIPNAVSFTNHTIGGVTHITIHINKEANIKAKVLKSTGLCPLTVGEHANAHYSGQSTVKAEGGVSWSPTVP
jgi:hypothetical protein